MSTANLPNLRLGVGPESLLVDETGIHVSPDSAAVAAAHHQPRAQGIQLPVHCLMKINLRKDHQTIKVLNKFI